MFELWSLLQNPTSLSPMWLMLPCFWFGLTKVDRATLQSLGNRCGTLVSSYGQRIPGWNTAIEPMVIQQLSKLFLFACFFVVGLTNDNQNHNEIQDTIRREFARMTDTMRRTEATMDRPGTVPTTSSSDGSDTATLLSPGTAKPGVPSPTSTVQADGVAGTAQTL